jgi:arylsulfatase A-like enzyme
MMVYRSVKRLLFILLCPALHAASPARPNILLAFADDLGRYGSCYRDAARPSPDDVLATPSLDLVAREGALFENAFVSVSSCSPSRAAVISGRHFFRNGSHSQLHTPWDGPRENDPWNEVKGFPLLLQSAGYHIGWSYKMHISEDRMGGRSRNYQQAGGRINSFSEVMTAAKDRPATREAILDEVRRNFRRFLSDRKDGQPFYYWFNPTNTHRTWVKGSGKDIWGIDPDSLKGKLPPHLPDNAAVREDFADYLGEIQAFDAAVGILLDELRQRGELDNTLFAVSGDNGIPGFPRGKTGVHDFGARVPLAIRWPESVKPAARIATPVSLIDLAPTFLAAAGLPPEAGMNGENLLPVLSGKAPESSLRGHAVIGREIHFHTARAGNLPYPVRALRSARFLYVRNFAPDRNPLGDPFSAADPAGPDAENLAQNTGCCFPDLDSSPTKTWLVQHRTDPGLATIWKLGFAPRPAEEFYDLQKDPHQIHNLLAGEENTDAVIKEQVETHRNTLMRILRENHDPRLDNAFDRPPYLVSSRSGPAKRKNPRVLENKSH